MRRKISSFIIVFLIVFLGFALYDNFVAKESVLNKTEDNILKIGSKEVKIEIADSQWERIKGLSGRESLEEGTGLLFVFTDSDLHGFWMKEMNFPIDIIWINEDFSVVHVEKSVLPETYPKTFRPKDLARYVLEVNAGFSDANGVEVGSKVDFPENFFPKN